MTEPTVQLVAEVILEENGSGFRASHPRNLIASDDEWFSPVQAEVGPDGHIWIADWYNYIIQHNAESDRQEPTPGNAYANPLRDRQHGRIYRIVYEGAGTAERFTLARARPQKLVSTLTHDNMFWRKHAQRLLVERGNTDVAPMLIDLISDRSVDGTGLNAGVIHALWTLHGLGVLDQPEGDAFEAVVNALLHPSSGVRKNAIQVLPAAAESITALLEYCLIDDPDMQVRLAAIVALTDMPPSHDAGAALYNILGKPDNLSDRWIREAGALAAAVHNIGFLAAADAAGMLPDASSIPADATTENLDGIIALVLSEDPDAVAQIGQVAATVLPPAVDRVLQMGVIENEMRFDLEELRVQAGQTIRIDFVNTDNMEHNLLILNPGTLAEIGRLADEMITAPDGRQRMYVPDSPDVLAWTPLLDPGESYQLVFRVPDQPGEYPFVCTIPGHWRIMNGVMIVE